MKAWAPRRNEGAGKENFEASKLKVKKLRLWENTTRVSPDGPGLGTYDSPRQDTAWTQHTAKHSSA